MSPGTLLLEHQGLVPHNRASGSARQVSPCTSSRSHQIGSFPLRPRWQKSHSPRGWADRVPAEHLGIIVIGCRCEVLQEELKRARQAVDVAAMVFLGAVVVAAPKEDVAGSVD